MRSPNHTGSITELKGRLAKLDGPARCHPLVELGATHMDRYWRTGPGSPAGLADLNAAIDALNEAYGYLQVNDPFRGLIAAGLGQQLSLRHSLHGGAERDRDTAIHLLDESLAFPDQPRMAPLIAKVNLAQLLLSRTSAAMQSVMSDPMRLMREGLPKSNTADLDRAVALLRDVSTNSAAGAELVGGAKSMLSMAESMQAMFGALGGGGLDLNRVGQAMGAMQQAMGQAGNLSTAFRNAGANPFNPGFPGGGSYMPPPILNLDNLTPDTPLDYPVTVVTGSDPGPTEPVAVPRQRDAPPVTKLDLETARRDLRTALRTAAPSTPDPASDARLARALLATDALDRPTIDDLVARATVIAGADEAGAEDLFLLGVTLFLRARDDATDAEATDDWGDDDASAAANALLTALAGLPADHPAAAFVPDALRALAALGQPLDAVLAGADRMPGPDAPTVADLAEAVRTIGADLLVQPLPGTALMLDPSTDRVTLETAGVADAARAALPRTGLPRLIVVAGGTTPWAAAPDSSGRPLAADVVVTHASSGAEVVRLAGRTARPMSAGAVFVANPRGDRESAGVEAMMLRRLFHPGSTGLGRTIEDVDGIGTPAEVERGLATAALVHLGCGVRGPALELAGPDELRLGLQAADDGALVVLSTDADAPEEIAAGLLSAGAVAVVGWLKPVPDAVAALMIMLLHANLVDAGAPPALAVNAVHRWMLGPDRKPVDGVPSGHLAAVADLDLTDPELWGSLYHRGR